MAENDETNTEKAKHSELNTEILDPYDIDDLGVFYWKFTKILDEEEKSQTTLVKAYILQTPATITALSDDIDNKGIFYKLRITHPVIGTKKIWISQEDLLTREGLKKLVSQGLICSENDYGRVEDYFSRDIHRASKGNIHKELISATTGWKRNETVFIAGNRGYSVNGDQAVTLLNEEIAGSLEPKGTLEEWIRGTTWALSFPGTRINCYTVLAAVIAGYLKQPSPILQNKGETTTGKTLQSSIGLSLIGNPVEIMKSADTTRTGAERRAAATNGLCDVYDEVGLLKDPDGLVYMLSNGKGRQRGSNTKEGLESTGKWFKSFILNGEIPLLKDNAMQGEVGRFLECTWRLEKNSEEAKIVERAVKENYGLILPLFMKKLFEKLDSVKSRYHQLIKEMPEAKIEIGARMRDSTALLIIAGEILEEVFYDIGIEKMDAYRICVKLYQENATSDRVKPYWLRGLDTIYSIIKACKPDTSETPIQDRFMYKSMIGGSINNILIDIEPAVLKEICQDQELDYNKLISDWNKQKLTVCNKGRNQYSIDGNHRVIRLQTQEVLKALELNYPNETDERNSQESENQKFLERRIAAHVWAFRAGTVRGDPFETYRRGAPDDIKRFGEETIRNMLEFYINKSVVSQA